jgi:predicted RNase H-like HicB family nuclease
MQYKLIATVAGAISYGALVGWAVTADYYEQKLADSKATNNGLRDALYEQTQGYRHPDAVTAKPFDSETIEFESIIDFPPEDDLRELEDSIVEGLKQESEAEKAPGGVASEQHGTGDEEDAVVPEGETPEETRSNLQSLIDQYTADEDDVDRFIRHASEEQKQSNDPPFVISKEKYAWDEEEGDDYDKVTVTYFPNARMVLDDDEDPMEDVARTLGWKNLQRFGDESGDPDVVFIRNRTMMTDFEVVRDEENELPLHVKYGMPREEFETNKAAGLIKFRPEDNGRA